MKNILILTFKGIFYLLPKLKLFLNNNFFRGRADKLQQENKKLSKRNAKLKKEIEKIKSKDIFSKEKEDMIKVSYRVLSQLSNTSGRHPESIDVAVYFYGSLTNIYQLKQWFSVFDEIAKVYKFTILVRSLKVYEELLINEFDVRYLHSIDDVDAFYNKNSIKVLLYVNNGVKNFQSLMSSNSIHIHINHGESEKSCMYSNQSKAYDRVFCVGKAAVDRYKRHLLNFDASKYRIVGRPQLDFVQTTEVEIPEDKNIIIYAPTWAATHESMNYSSIADYGVEMINNLLINEDNFVIYKPHPSVGSTCKKELRAHKQIEKIVRENDNGVSLISEDILKIFPRVDLAIFDNTSAAIDFLYFDRPMLITNYFDRLKGMPEFVKAARLLDGEDYLNIDSLVGDLLENDYTYDLRQEIKSYYLGEFEKGGSTHKFLQEIDDAIHEREQEQDTKLLLGRVET